MPEHDDFFQTTLPAHRPTWAEIDLDAFYHNYAAIKKRVGPGVKIIGVVKADAYGHGVDIPEMLQNEEKTFGHGMCNWWLRTKDDYYFISGIRYDGWVKGANVAEQFYAVRPALWINLELDENRK